MRVRFLPPLLLIALLLAGCGGSSPPKLGAGDVAAVGNQTVTLVDYQQALAEEKANLKSQGTAVPTAGSTDYTEMQTDIMDELFQQAVFAIEAQKDGIHITNAQVDSELATLKKKDFKGSQATYEAAIKKAGYTNAEIVASIREKLLQDKLFASVVKNVKPTAAEVSAYYTSHLSSYQTPASRKVEYILVGKGKKALAAQIIAQLKAGTATFAALAKKYSQDPTTKDKGGVLTVTEGETVAQFNAAVFAPTAKTGTLLPAVDTTQYGWFVIEPLAAIVPEKTKPEAEEAASIRATLTSNEQNAELTTWYAGVEKTICTSDSITYAVGYAPSPTPCSTLTATNQTTT